MLVQSTVTLARFRLMIARHVNALTDGWSCIREARAEMLRE
jgi:hypothetical protein